MAKEFGVTVWAADYWVKTNDNMERIQQAGFPSSVFPVSVEAHALPFSERSFDAIVSFDAYHYFGTDDLYLGYISSFLKLGGRLGIVVPGTREELSEVPPHTHLRNTGSGLDSFGRIPTTHDFKKLLVIFIHLR